MLSALILAVAAPALAAVAETGKWLFRYDAATTAATQALAAAKVPLDGPGVYIARESSDGTMTVFYGSLDDAGTHFTTRYAERRNAGTRAFSLVKDADDPELVPMAHAVATALKRAAGPTDLDYTYAADVRGDKTIDVYVYPASQPSAAFYVWGADYAFHFSASGTTMLSHDLMHRGYFQFTDSSKFQKGGEPFYARSRNAAPDATDVLFTMLLGAPLYVEYTGGVYRIEPNGDVHPDTMPNLADKQVFSI